MIKKEKQEDRERKKIYAKVARKRKVKQKKKIWNRKKENNYTVRKEADK